METNLQKTSAILVALALALALTACGGTASKIGETVKGERVAILESTRKLEADKGMSEIKPVLPNPALNLEWMQAGYDSSHVMPPSALSAAPQKIWSRDIGRGSNSDYKLLASPVIGNGAVLTMDAVGTVQAFDAATGEPKWKTVTNPENSDEKTIGGGIALDRNAVYATTGFGEVLALDAQSGRVLWRRSVINPVRAAPTFSQGRIYVVTIDNRLTALDSRTGNILWHHNGVSENATLMGASSPAAMGDNVVVAYSSGEIYNLRAANGRASWSYALTSPAQVGALPAIADIRGLPVIDRGRIYAIGHSGRMAAIDQRTGDRVWEADLGGIQTPLVLNDTVFVLGNDAQLAAIQSSTGRVLWVKALQQRVDPADSSSDFVHWAGPIAGGGKLWLANSRGQLMSFAPADGAEGETVDIGSSVFVPPVIANGTLYVVTDRGRLIALR
ncbi:MAG: PQQ-binding-like beta-propeller repeat protein [Bdellovibrionales bacterium]